MTQQSATCLKPRDLFHYCHHLPHNGVCVNRGVQGVAVLCCGDWILGVSEGALVELDDYYAAMVVLANVVMRLACIVCAGAAGGLF